MRSPRLAFATVLTVLLAACGSSDAPATNAAAQQAATSSTPSPASAPPRAPAGAPAPADLLGTIEATIDGRAGTWHIVAGEAGGRPYSAALWYEPDEESTWGVVGGFDTPTPPVETFRFGPAGMFESYGEYRGSIFTMVLATAGDPGPFRLELPSFDNSSSVIYLRQATLEDLTQMYSMEAGVLNVTRMSVSGGRLSAEGTFSGTFENPEGATVTITDGRFSVEGAPHLDTLTGA